jgi:hypothetical protein
MPVPPKGCEGCAGNGASSTIGVGENTCAPPLPGSCGVIVWLSRYRPAGGAAWVTGIGGTWLRRITWYTVTVL